MAMPRVSLWNDTDETWHVRFEDEMAIRVVMSRIASSSFWLGVLTTLVGALILLSTARQRKGPTFLFQCMAFILAIVYNVLVFVRAIWRHHSTFRMPDELYDPGRENRAQTTILVLEHWIPLVANAAVISKVIGFYPPQLYTLKRRLLYISPPIFLLFSRAVLICYLTYIANLMYTEATSIFGQVQQVFNLDVADQFVIIGTTIFATEAAFCLYTSCFLIYKICQFYFNLKQQDGRGIRRKSRFFLEITCMTFIPPLALSITCACLLYESDEGPSKYREVVGVLANISVVFSLLASSWSTIRRHNKVKGDNDDEEDSKDREISLATRICFGPQPLDGLRHKRHTEANSTPMVLHLFKDDEESRRPYTFWTEEVAESMPLAAMSGSVTTRGDQPA